MASHRKPQYPSSPTADRTANQEYLKSRMRECHDCHKLTWNYRCTECDRKHKMKYGVPPSISDAED